MLTKIKAGVQNVVGYVKCIWGIFNWRTYVR
jgi:hypothetical protein